MEKYQELKELMYKYQDYGLEVSPVTGAIKIGRAKHVAPLAWSNELYPVLSNEEIESLEKEIGLRIPDAYKVFLTTFSNGMVVLTTTLSLYGLRKYNSRDNIEYVFQPFDIVRVNTFERPKNMPDNMFIIGSYNWDGSFITMTTDNKVHYCKRDDATSLITWNSLEEMLVSEIKRIYTLYDEKGVKIDEDASPLPDE